jgi:hypothetical protein
VALLPIGHKSLTCPLGRQSRRFHPRKGPSNAPHFRQPLLSPRDRVSGLRRLLPPNTARPTRLTPASGSFRGPSKPRRHSRPRSRQPRLPNRKGKSDVQNDQSRRARQTSRAGRSLRPHLSDAASTQSVIATSGDELAKASSPRSIDCASAARKRNKMRRADNQFTVRETVVATNREGRTGFQRSKRRKISCASFGPRDSSHAKIRKMGFIFASSLPTYCSCPNGNPYVANRRRPKLSCARCWLRPSAIPHSPRRSRRRRPREIAAKGGPTSDHGYGA